MRLNVQKTSEKGTSKAKNKAVSKTPLTFITHEELLDKYEGKKGTPSRNEFDHKIRMRGFGYMIYKARKERKLTQEQLGKLVGVQKAQISKLENSLSNATIDTILKVFKALNAEVHFRVKLNGEFMSFTDEE